MQVEFKNTEIVQFSDLIEGDTFVINGNEVFMKIKPVKNAICEGINAIRLNGPVAYKHVYDKDTVAKKHFKLAEE